MFGQRLKELRLSFDMKQSDVAVLLGMSGSAVGAYERDEREPNLQTIKLLCALFNVTSDYLLGYSEYKFSNLNDAPVELIEFFKSCDVDFLGNRLNDKDKRRIIDMLVAMFWQ